MARKKRSPDNAITVGSYVSFEINGNVFHAEVVEDRGNVGYQGRRVLRIRTCKEYEEARETFEIPAERVTVEPRAA